MFFWNMEKHWRKEAALSKEEQKALLAAVSQNLPEGDRAQMQQIMGLMGL